MAALQGQFQFRPSIMPLPGEPTEEFGQLMDSRIQAYDQGVASEAAFNNTLSTFEVAPGYEGVRNELATAAEQRLAQVAEKYKGAYEDPRFQREAMAIQRELVKNPAYSTLAQNKVNYDLYNQQKIENPNQYDFNSYEQHVKRDIEENNGIPTIFTPHRENILDVNAAADTAIEPFLSYIDTRTSYQRIPLRDEQGNVMGYNFVSKDKVDFKISDAYDPTATDAQRREALNMIKLLREHSLDSFKREEAGDQFYRKRQLIDGVQDQAALDAEAMDILIDRFPGVKSAKERSMGTINVGKTGAGTTPEEEIANPLAINKPVLKQQDIKEEDAWLALQLKNQEALSKIEGGQEALQERMEQDFTADADGNIVYKDTSSASPEAATSIENTLSEAVQAKNMANAIVGISSALADEYKIPQSVWPNLGDWESINKPALARMWVKEEDFNAAIENVEKNMGFFERAASDVKGMFEDEAEYTQRVENIAAEQVLSKNKKWINLVKARDEKALIALEQNSTSFPYIQFNELVGAPDKREMDGKITHAIKNNPGSFTLYNTQDFTQDGTEDYIESLLDGSKGIELISYTPAGARKENDQGAVMGDYDPSQGEIVAWLGELDDSGKMIPGEREQIIIRGYNVDNQLLNRKISPNAMADSQLRANVANIIESNTIPPDDYYDLTANDINVALRSTMNLEDIPHNLSYSDLMRQLWPQGRANLPNTQPGYTPAGTDLLNLSIKRERTPAGTDQYVLYGIQDGVRRPIKIPGHKVYAVGEANAAEGLSAQLQAYYDALINDLYTAEQE